MLSLSSFIKTAKRSAFNPCISNEDFLNAMLEPYVIAGRVTGRGNTDFYLDKHQTSKILNGNADVPLALRKIRLQHGLEQRVAKECDVIWDETLNPAYFDNFKNDILSLIDFQDSKQKAIGERLNLKTYSPDEFLACVLVGVVELPNTTETEGLIWRKGSGSLYWKVGDLFRFGFCSRKNHKNLVVIPVDCSFETHVTRGYEGLRIKRVSENTIHGKWLTRMIQSGILEQELKERLSYELENYIPDKQGCYPIGTVATIETKKSVFILLAVSRFNEKGNTYCSPSDISVALDCLLEYYDQQGQGANLYLPLIGTGLSRAGLNSQESFNLIVDTVTAKTHFIGGTITIVLQPDSAKEIGLTK